MNGQPRAWLSIEKGLRAVPTPSRRPFLVSAICAQSRSTPTFRRPGTGLLAINCNQPDVLARCHRHFSVSGGRFYMW